MSKNSITISPKHGLNPSMGICAWCGEETGEILLMGKIPNSDDAEAPKYAIANYTPCSKCQDAWKEAVMLIEVSTKPLPDNRPPIQTQNDINLYPTFRHVGITEEAAQRIGINLSKGEKAFLDTGAFNNLFGDLDAFKGTKGS